MACEPRLPEPSPWGAETSDSILKKQICIGVLAARSARGLQVIFRTSRSERAQGMPDARCTRGLVCNVHKKVRTRAYRAAEAIRHSLRNGFTAYPALSPATNSSCHRH